MSIGWILLKYLLLYYLMILVFPNLKLWCLVTDLWCKQYVWNYLQFKVCLIISLFVFSNGFAGGRKAYEINMVCMIEYSSLWLLIFDDIVFATLDCWMTSIHQDLWRYRVLKNFIFIFFISPLLSYLNFSGGIYASKRLQDWCSIGCFERRPK